MIEMRTATTENDFQCMRILQALIKNKAIVFFYLIDISMEEQFTKSLQAPKWHVWVH